MFGSTKPNIEILQTNASHTCWNASNYDISCHLEINTDVGTIKCTRLMNLHKKWKLKYQEKKTNWKSITSKNACQVKD